MIIVKEKIFAIFHEKLGIERDMLLENDFKALEMDDLDLIMLTVCLEDAFDLVIESDQMEKIKSFPELLVFVQGLIVEQSPEGPNNLV